MAWIRRHPFSATIVIGLIAFFVITLVFFVLFGEASGEGGVTPIG